MIATVFALEFESAAFRTVQCRRLCVSIWTLGVTGQRSAAALQRMIEKNRPEIIVSAGFSGALQPDLDVGTIVIGENFSDPKIVGDLRIFPDFRTGLIVTVPENWGPRQIAMFQAHCDAMLSGNLKLKSKIRFLPSGMKPFDIKNASGESLFG